MSPPRDRGALRPSLWFSVAASLALHAAVLWGVQVHATHAPAPALTVALAPRAPAPATPVAQRAHAARPVAVHAEAAQAVPLVVPSTAPTTAPDTTPTPAQAAVPAPASPAPGLASAAPVAPPRPAPDAAGLSRTLTQLMNARKRYPPLARRLGLEGRVVVEALIDERGQLIDASIRQSAGVPLLDQDALALLQSVSPLAVESFHLAGPTRVQIPVGYVLE